MLVIASKPGQLGNRLFLFANFIGSALEHNFTFMNPAFDEYADYFPTTRRDLFCRYPPRSSLIKGGRASRRLLYLVCYYAARALVRSRANFKHLRALALDWDELQRLDDPQFLASVKRSQLFFLQGWAFRDDAALAKHADHVRQFFRPSESFRANVAALVARARSRSDVLVGLHVRHGDYRTFQGGKYFYELDVYAALMESVQSMFAGRSVCFLVCSNAEHGEAAFSRFMHVRGTGHLIEDLYALAECDYILGPPSTYTMWASFYGRTPLYVVEDPQRAPSLADFTVYGDDAKVVNVAPSAGEVEGVAR